MAYKIINRGITLIELLIYISIFSLLVMSLLSTSYYLQKIIQLRSNTYKIKECVYTQLNLLQHYLDDAKVVEISQDYIKIVFPDKEIYFLLNTNNNLEIYYKYKESQKNIIQCDQIQFSNISFVKTIKPQTLTNKSNIQFKIEFTDTKKHVHYVEEYLTTPNLAPTPIF